MSHPAADLPRRHRLSVADYYRMGEVGILPPDVRVELIEGEIIDMPPPGSAHAAVVDRLTELFVRAVEGKASVRVQNPVRLSEYSEPQPDLSLLRRRDDFYSAHHPRSDDVLLVVEVADSSLRYDSERKLSLYARHGIEEYWLVSLPGRRLVRHLAPQQGEYTLVDRPDLGAAVTVSALPGVAVDLQYLFR